MTEHTMLPVWGVGMLACIMVIVLGWRNAQQTGNRRWLRYVVAGAMNMFVLASAIALRYLPLKEEQSDLIGVLLVGVAATSLLVLFSHVDISNDERRNIWWSGFLQGIAVSFFLAIAVIMLLGRR